MFSMTGYGKGEFAQDGLTVTVEIKSVNNRFLDLAFKAPRVLISAEERVRTLVRESISRGHVDVFVSYTDRRERARTFTVDRALAAAYLQAAHELESLGAANDVTASTLLRLPDVVVSEEPAGDDPLFFEVFEAALKAALAAHKRMREAEGERLRGDLALHMAEIAKLRNDIEKRAPMVAKGYLEKLSSRIEEYLGGKVEETRILTEAALYADKCSIDEELTRLSSHITEFYAICEQEQVGRKLDFLVQEFNRECNTVCSKSNDKEITAFALSMKNEIEKVREQIQNLE